MALWSRKGVPMSSEKPLRTYDVTLIVTQPMTYRVRAAYAEEAEDIAFERGELIGTGDVIDYQHVSTQRIIWLKEA
jgi:hypothetical protein